MNKKICVSDCHSHILPCMDDGAKTVEESILMLEQAQKQGIENIIATPHFYPKDDDIEDFLKRRRKSIELLSEKYDESKFPNIYIGAEVAYFKGIGRAKGIEKTAIMGTDYILIEMPFEKWGKTVIEDILTLKNDRGLNPVIAHLDRYMHLQSRQTLWNLHYSDILMQMNAEYILKPFRRKIAANMIESGIIHILGSDSHGATERPQNIQTVSEKLENQKIINKLNFNAEIILSEAIPMRKIN